MPTESVPLFERVARAIAEARLLRAETRRLIPLIRQTRAESERLRLERRDAYEGAGERHRTENN